MNRLPSRTWLYFSAQSINLTTAVMSVTMAAIVGSQLAPAPSLATLPYGMQFFCLMLATWPAARLMQRLGRRRAFALGALPLGLSGVLGYLAVEHGSFGLLVVSHGLLGVYIAFANFNRFAAADGLPEPLKASALSLVVAGGVIAAVAGPSLTEWLRAAHGFAAFSLCYAVFAVMAVAAWLITLRLPPACHLAPQAAVASGAMFDRSRVLLAMALAAAGYGVMNLLMIQASLHMQHEAIAFSDVRLAIQWHVLAMFAPSFVTGTLIRRLGLGWVLTLGLALLAGCMTINLMGSGHLALSLALVLLGLGWNFTYVGGAALLARHSGEQAGRLQGLNDLAIAVCATLGAFLPSPLLAWVGFGGSNLLCLGVLGLLAVGGLVVLGGRRAVHREGVSIS